MDVVKLLKTYKAGERLPERWISLHWRERRHGFVALQLTLMMPWKARLYSISNDQIEFRHPRVAIWWERNNTGMWQPRGLRWHCDHFRHECTHEEFARQQAGCTYHRATASNLAELQTHVKWPVKVGDIVAVPNPPRIPKTWRGRLDYWWNGPPADISLYRIVEDAVPEPIDIMYEKPPRHG